MKSPICWQGNKNRMLKKLLPLIPQHTTYVEVFGGGAALLFAKQPTGVEVYNDIDSDLVNFFRVVRDNFEPFYHKVSMTPYSREEYNTYRDVYRETKDPVEKAAMFFMIARQSYASEWGVGWGYTVQESVKGMSAAVSAYLSAIDLLPQVHQRLQKVQIENDDWKRILARYDRPETFFYLDPPYLAEQRYQHPLAEEQHKELIEALPHLEGKVMLSGYPNSMYGEGISWHKVEFPTANYAVSRQYTHTTGEHSLMEHHARTETVWMNYTLQPKLF